MNAHTEGPFIRVNTTRYGELLGKEQRLEALERHFCRCESQGMGKCPIHGYDTEYLPSDPDNHAIISFKAEDPNPFKDHFGFSKLMG